MHLFSKSNSFLKHFFTLILSVALLYNSHAQEVTKDFEIVKYNNPNTSSFLGVGLWAWPLPMDYDGDGDMDMLVSCPDKPFNGLYFFENTTGEDFPDFAPPVRIGDAIKNVQISHIDEGVKVTIPGVELVDFKTKLASSEQVLFDAEELKKGFEKVRFNQWKMVDYDGDGDLDVVVGIDDWADYGWDNAFNDKGVWVNGPLHGFVFLLENVDGKYVNKGRIEAGGKMLDVYGAPSPNFADFDGDGDLDLICGEFLDRMTYFENTGTRQKPFYKEGVFLKNDDGLIKMDLEMIIPVAVDWDKDGHIDLVVGDEDGRVALIRNTGTLSNNIPQFESAKYFRQQSDNLKFGALATPVSVDWDNDGDEDIITGNSAGYFAFIENIGGGENPVWEEPKLLEAGGEVIRIQADDNGSIQGPAEAKWGYTTLSVADWDGDGNQDIIFNSIWGKIEWIKNTGSGLEAPQPIKVLRGDEKATNPAWNWWKSAEDELVTQWRTTPVAVDWDKDGVMDLVMLDFEGYLAFYKGINENGEQAILPGERIFYGDKASVYTNRDKAENDEAGQLRLNNAEAGGSGRRKISFVDWDNDGDLDLLVNSVNVTLFENISQESDKVIFSWKGPLSERILAGHTTSPTVVDWDKNGEWEVLVGAEDGHFYHFVR
ncbi:VCBS repeat protein [Algoriphagus ratkowskyi]|uniref:VCBS repeat protein n=1 Tax=Algoriphagus ratkowskyi TaxID=57028 RepID=A0A2W7SQT1_9BACT|nr:FG-GAP-like repeat-containing protein [Algoriphagus ratkowskyi]PZX53072.1 VCBS repeat protein [Algoriphagus ratkowskyi]TXD76353.1 VCBS repeat-containing protein [Algoriphagus ratkowskyi]